MVKKATVVLIICFLGHSPAFAKLEIDRPALTRPDKHLAEMEHFLFVDDEEFDLQKREFRSAMNSDIIEGSGSGALETDENTSALSTKEDEGIAQSKITDFEYITDDEDDDKKPKASSPTFDDSEGSGDAEDSAPALDGSGEGDTSSIEGSGDTDGLATLPDGTTDDEDLTTSEDGSGEIAEEETTASPVPTTNLPTTTTRRTPDEDEYEPNTGNFYIRTCGETYFCRERRGPCRQDEMFVPSSHGLQQSWPCSKQSLWARGCYPTGNSLLNAGPFYKGGRCVSRPCADFPPHYRYNKATGSCQFCPSALPRPLRRAYEYLDAEICGHGKMFADIDGATGECRCSNPYKAIWNIDGKCHSILAQGPCAEGDWIFPDSRGRATCQKSPCAELADGQHIYWDKFGRPGCYKSYTRGPCDDGMLFVIEDYYKMRASCHPAELLDFGPNYIPPELTCGPGKEVAYLDGINRECRCSSRYEAIWKDDVECFPIFTQGPCNEGEWFHPSARGRATCQKSPCPNLADGQHIYWDDPTQRAGCYKSYTQGPCEYGSQFIIESYYNRKASCRLVNDNPVNRYGSRDFINNRRTNVLYRRRLRRPNQGLSHRQSSGSYRRDYRRSMRN